MRLADGGVGICMGSGIAGSGYLCRPGFGHFHQKYIKAMSIMFYLQNGGGAGALLSNYGLLMLMLVVIWLFFFRPQAKKQKAQAKFLEEMQKGDEVATASGLIGRINKIENGIITLQVDQKTFIRVTKSSVSKEMTEAIQKATATPTEAAKTS